jgi:hypothetical protein
MGMGRLNDKAGSGCGWDTVSCTAKRGKDSPATMILGAVVETHWMRGDVPGILPHLGNAAFG